MTGRIKQCFRDRASRGYVISAAIVIIGLLGLFIFYKYGVLKILRYLVLLIALFIISWIDNREHIILNKHLLIMVGIRTFLLICEWLAYPSYGLVIAVSSLTGLAIGAGLFGICYLISRGGMGAGDVKLMAVAGYYLGGSDIMPVTILTVAAAAIYSIVKLIQKKTTLKEEIPFAPFVLIGTILAMVLGV